MAGPWVHVSLIAMLLCICGLFCLNPRKPLINKVRVPGLLVDEWGQRKPSDNQNRTVRSSSNARVNVRILASLRRATRSWSTQSFILQFRAKAWNSSEAIGANRPVKQKQLCASGFLSRRLGPDSPLPASSPLPCKPLPPGRDAGSSRG